MNGEIKPLKKIYESCDKNIKKNLKIVEFSAGERIVKQGEKHDYACIIVEGKAKISVMTEAGKSIIVGIMNEWDLFGETELFDKSSKEFDAEAITNCKVIIIDEKILFEWLEKDFELVKYTLAQLSKKLNISAKNLITNTLYPLEYRFSLLIFSHYNKNNKMLEMDKELIANLLGSTVRSVNRLIESFEKQDIINYSKGIIKVVDLDKIEAAIAKKML